MIMNILYKFRFSFLLAFLGICLFLTTNTAYGLDSLARERLRKHIHSQMDKQIAQNALNDKLGKSNLNDYVMNINTLDPDETDHFKINEVNNGKTLWNLSGAAFSSPTNGIKKILQDANAGLVGKPKVYLVLIAIYDYNEAVLKWDKEKQRPTTAVNWGEKLKELADKKGNKNATENTNPRFNNGENRTNLGSFVTSIVASKITGTQISPYSIACFSMYIAKVDKTVTPAQVTYDINTSIYRQEDVPKSVLDIIDPIANSCLNTPDRNECLRKVVEVLCSTLYCNNITPAQRSAEITTVRTALDNILTATPNKRVIVFPSATTIFPLINPVTYRVSDMAILEEKLQLLNDIAGYDLRVVINNTNFHPCEGSDLFADVVKQASTQLKKTNKDGFIYIALRDIDYHHPNTLSTNYLASVSNAFGSEMGAHLQDIVSVRLDKYNKDIIASQGAFSGLIEEYVRTLYKALPKPATVYTYMMSGKGDITELPIQKTNSIKGLDIYNFVLVEDKRIKELITEQNRILIIKALLGAQTNPSANSIALANTEIEQSQAKIDLIETTLPSDNDLIVIDHQLREPLLQALASETFAGAGASGTIKYNALARQFVRWRLKEYVGDGLVGVFPTAFLENAPPNSAFETGKNEPKIAKDKEAIDDLGLALAPFGLDFLADAYGAVYCFTNNDATGGLLYSAFAVIPVADKALKIADKGYDFLRKANYAYDIRLVTQGKTLSTLIPLGEIVIRTLFKNVPFAQLDVNFLLKVKELGFSQRQIKALDADFLNNIVLFNAMKADHTLLQAWKKVHSLTDNGFNLLKKDPDFLRKFQDVALNKHIFDGEPKLNGGLLTEVGGVHSNKKLKSALQITGLNRGNVRIQPETKVDLRNGYYQAKVQIYGDKGTEQGTRYIDGWVKGKRSTFFPDDWSVEKIQAEIASAKPFSSTPRS